MKRLAILTICFTAAGFMLGSAFLCNESRAATTDGQSTQVRLPQGPDISAQYLKQARAYREQGRLELSRQTYAQALSTAQSNESAAVIKHELGGVELLLRTMR